MIAYIPNDIMDAAVALANRISTECKGNKLGAVISMSLIIGKALKDERDESANIASTYSGDDLADIVRKDRTP